MCSKPSPVFRYHRVYALLDWADTENSIPVQSGLTHSHVSIQGCDEYSMLLQESVGEESEVFLHNTSLK